MTSFCSLYVDGGSIIWQRKYPKPTMHTRYHSRPRHVNIVIPYHPSHDNNDDPPNGRNRHCRTCFDDDDRGNSCNRLYDWVVQTTVNSMLSMIITICMVCFAVKYHTDAQFQKQTNVSIWYMITMAYCWQRCH